MKMYSFLLFLASLFKLKENMLVLSIKTNVIFCENVLINCIIEGTFYCAIIKYVFHHFKLHQTFIFAGCNEDL